MNDVLCYNCVVFEIGYMYSVDGMRLFLLYGELFVINFVDYN